MLGAFDAASLAARHRGLATLLVVRRPAGQGNVGIDGEGRIVRLRKESVAQESAGGDFVGMHVVSETLDLPERGCIVGDVYIPALARRAIYAEYTDVDFIDVGTLAGYRAANRAWLAHRGMRAWTGEGANVSCVLEESIVGAGAEATGEGALVRCVVWPGAHARAPLADAVVTRTRTIE